MIKDSFILKLFDETAAPGLRPAAAGSALPVSRLQSCFNESKFQRWWESKLQSADSGNPQVIELRKPGELSAAEHRACMTQLARHNFCIYSTRLKLGNQDILTLSRQFGLENAEKNLCANSEAISEITVSEQGIARRYIPYSNRAMSWHTDGYYNDLGNPVNTFILHCENPAPSGGENRFLDHELMLGWLYAKLGDQLFDLFAKDVFCIPANLSQGQELRPQTSGPMFYFNQRGGLQMRYSARSRNISWRRSDSIDTARKEITRRLDDNPLISTCRLESGMGIISKNVLHSRSAFTDDSDSRRLLYRARFYDVVTNPDCGALLYAVA